MLCMCFVEARNSCTCVLLLIYVRYKTYVWVLHSFPSVSLLYHTNPSSSLSHVWHDSLLFVTRLPRICMCLITHSRVTLSHIYMTPVHPLVCDMPPSHVWHDSLSCRYVSVSSHLCHDSLSFVTWLPLVCDMCDMTPSHLYECYYSFTPDFLLYYMTPVHPLICDMTPSHVWHDSLSCRYASLLIHMWLSLVSHINPFTCPSHLWHDSLSFVICLPLMCDMTPSHADIFHYSIMCDSLSAREAFWRRVFDPFAPLLFSLYHYLEQNLHFGLVPHNPFWVSRGRY